MEGDEDDSEWPITSFFKIILEPRDDFCKLEIPTKFLALHGKNLYELVSLHMPTGRVWHVNLIRENGKTFLQNGWPKFAKFYSLSQGHFLKFDFIGNSSFKVIIIGMNACEIIYPCLHSTPCNRPHESLSPPNKRQSTGFVRTPCIASEEVPIIKEETDVQTVKDHRQPIKTKSCRPENIVTPFPPTTTSSSKVVKEGKTSKDKAPIDIIVSITGRKSGSFAEQKKRIEAHVRAHPLKHPSFATKFPPSYAKHCLSIPSEFARKYMDINQEQDEFIIETKAGRKWKMWTCGSVPRLKFGKGCQEFITDNKLGVSDVCIFQLIDKQHFKVDIVRGAHAKVVKL